MKHSNKEGLFKAFCVTSFILIALFIIAIPLLYAFAGYTQSVDIQAVQLQEPVVMLTPTTFTIDIQNFNNTPLNAVEFELWYDPGALTVVSIVPHATLCEERFVISNTINNASGTALFQCGTVTPFSGTTATIATVHALSLSSGTTSISFGTTTHLLAHDGFGTDVTRDRNDLVFISL